MMFKLASDKPAWISLFPELGDGKTVEVLFAPIEITAVRAARRAVAASFSVDADNIELAGDEFTRQMLRRGVLDWRGIGDDDGNAIAVTPETVEAFIADPRTFEAADRLYVMPWVRSDMEKNGSSASPNGTGQAAKQAAGTAKRSAGGGKKAGAGRTRAKREKAAPISPKPSRPTKATPPGM